MKSDGVRTPPDEGPPEAAWYESAFEAAYLHLYAHRNESDARRATDFIASRIGLDSATSLLDLCCGPGRHLKFLARMAGRTIGLDLSAQLLARAAQTLEAADDASAGRGGNRSSLLRGDMRVLPLGDASVDLVINLFTSFGYFDSDEENAGVLAEVSRVLRPGGHFVIDHINRTRLIATLDPSSERELEDGSHVRETRTFDALASRVRKHVHWQGSAGAAREWDESVRVYAVPEMADMLLGSGLRPCGDAFGDFDATPCDADSPRMIFIARKE